MFIDQGRPIAQVSSLSTPNRLSHIDAALLYEIITTKEKWR